MSQTTKTEDLPIFHENGHWKFYESRVITNLEWEELDFYLTTRPPTKITRKSAIDWEDAKDKRVRAYIKKTWSEDVWKRMNVLLSNESDNTAYNMWAVMKKEYGGVEHIQITKELFNNLLTTRLSANPTRSQVKSHVAAMMEAFYNLKQSGLDITNSVKIMILDRSIVNIELSTQTHQYLNGIKGDLYNNLVTVETYSARINSCTISYSNKKPTAMITTTEPSSRPGVVCKWCTGNHYNRECTTAPMCDAVGCSQRRGHTAERCWVLHPELKKTSSTRTRPKPNKIQPLTEVSAYFTAPFFCDSAANYSYVNTLDGTFNYSKDNSDQIIGTSAAGNNIHVQGTCSLRVLLQLPSERRTQILHGVLYSPQISENLLSVNRICNNGMRWEFNKMGAQVFDEEENVWATASCINGLYLL